jgi:phosphatidylglycerophosphate synthase
MLRFSLEDVESCLQRKSWWAVIFILPAARRLALFIVNHTKLTPNQITLGSFVLVFPAAALYADGSYLTILFAVVLFELNYLFDCVDGTLARLKECSSPVGGYLDAILDRVRVLILCLAFGFGQLRAGGSVTLVFWLLLYLGVNNLIIITRAYQERSLAKAGFGSRLGVDLVKGDEGRLLTRWLDFTRAHNLMPYYHDVELDALVFVVGPVLNRTLGLVQLAVISGSIVVIILNVFFIYGLARRANARG